MKTLRLLLISLITSAVAFAQPANDDACNAIALNPNGTVGSYTNVGATVQAGEAAIAPPQTGCATQDGWCGAESGIDGSVWFTFVSANTSATISTCSANSIDTQVAVYAATDCTDFGTLTLIGANDDGAGCAGFSSLLDVSGLNIGETYWVLVDGYNGDAGNFDFSIFQEGAPSDDNDDPCNAISLPTDGTVVAGSNIGATVAAGEDVITPPQTGCGTQDGWCAAESGIDASVWFKFTSANTSAEISTCYDESGDTQIAVYSATDCTDFGSLTLLGANDDGAGCPNFSSFLEVSGLAIGQTYWILVDGYNGEEGEFGISVFQDNNDNACTAIDLPTDGTVVYSTNVGATVAAGEDVITPPQTGCGTQDGWCTFESGIDGSVWFTFTAINTTASVTTCYPESGDTQLAAYTATDCTDFSTFALIGANDDGAGCDNFSSLLELSGLTAGQTYWVLVDGYNGFEGEFGISVLQSDPSAARVQVIHNSPDDAASVVDIYLDDALLFNDVAFRSASPFVDAPAGVEFVVSVAPSTSTSVADAIAAFPFTLAEGEKYIIVADGFTGLSSTVYNPAPAFNLEVYDMAREEATDGANTDILVHHGSTDAPTVDVAEVGVGAGIVVDDASYTDFAGYLELPTTTYQLAVQTADNSVTVATYLAALGGLEGEAITVVASGFLDPSVNGNGPAFGLWVALADGGALIELPLVPTNDNPCDAIELPTDGTVVTATNVGATVADGESDITPPQTGCATQDGWCAGEPGIDASVWFFFVATDDEATVTTCLDGNTIDTQIGVYSASDCTDFGTLALLGANDDAIDGCSSGASIFASVLDLTGLTIGETYWVLVDGYFGQTGDIAISITQVVGLSESTPVEFGMFPNPADETLWITSSENLESISIVDMQGRNVISQAGMFRQVDISNLAPGMYQVSVSTGDRVSVQKLIKE